jgi:hypothetical protein
MYSCNYSRVPNFDRHSFTPQLWAPRNIPSPSLPRAYSFPSSCSPPSSMVPCLCNLFFMLPQVLLHLSTRNVTAELGIICLIKEEEGCWLL